MSSNRSARISSFQRIWVHSFRHQAVWLLMLPHNYITLYSAFFKEGNFRLPITKFLAEVLTRHGVYISQISPVGMPQITHFEFI
ncbi:hypothetical protein Hanom_Chr03g00206521 [Helianthus anomalus]